MKPSLPCPTLIVLALVCLLHPAQAEDARPAPSIAPSASGGALSLSVLMANFDKDHDGRISKEEAAAAFVSRFAQWDANGDGFATRQEIHDFRLRLGIGDNGERVTRPKTSLAPGPAAARPVQTAPLLREPAGWRLEMMTVPPGFAPDVKLTGTEEIRFSPGMFDNTAADYFTCAIAITAENTPAFGSVELQDFLEKYYRGLSTSSAQRSGTAPNIAEMKAVVTPVPDAPHHFTAEVVFFDSFSDGRKITLNVEAEVFDRPAAKKTFMILLVSPSAKDEKPWKGLREIGRKAAKNVPAP